MKTDVLISYLLRVAIAFAFLYPPVSAYLNPTAWIWFVPDFVEIFLPKEIFLYAFSIFEILVALGVLFMKNPIIPALGAALALAAIVVIDWAAFDIVFRDISILLSAIALVLFEKERRKKRGSSG